MRRLLATLVIAGAALLGSAAPAFAHNVLSDSNPKAKSEVEAGPAEVMLKFDQEVQDGFNTVTVTGPNGTRWEGGTPKVNGAVVTAPLLPLGPAGEYTIGYRILSADGHPVTGAVPFTLTKAGNGTPTTNTLSPSAEGSTNAQAEDSSGTPVWLWIIGAAVLLIAGVAVALVLAKPSKKA
ncbi:copper resistance protein CopC [Crossiella sp. CA-258035]|uniref:copper resistance CopC family protein n=1 Tax=Crossiella sp. CA-258035 TaxID=2981138 RepID=UPI0024BC567C|nr:copper resistance CopC family protein [Crossiella sp. CA-258035]WHT19563.1 copper resistance protein CopC [Crossiella sp. CA-258035]